MSGPGLRPVVAIEVDGLLSVPVTRPEGEPPPDVIDTNITFHREDYPTRTQAQPNWDADGTWTTRYWFSTIGLEWVRGLLARGIEVVWASTWMDCANRYFGPALRLPDLLIALDADHWAGATVGDIKAEQLSRRIDGRPLLLVTDALPLAGRRALLQRRLPRDRATTRLQYIPWSSPVSSGDIAQMDHFLELSQTAEGREELRRVRRKDLARERRRRQSTEARDQSQARESLRAFGQYPELYPAGYLDEIREGWHD